MGEVLLFMIKTTTIRISVQRIRILILLIRVTDFKEHSLVIAIVLRF